MFRVSSNIEQPKTKKKKLLFISTMSSNESLSFEPKNFENNKIQSQSNSKSSSLSEPLPTPKKNKEFFGNSNNKYNNHKPLPMKRILFRLYRVNFMNSKREKGKTQTQNKKENNTKKNVNNNLKHKQRHVPIKNNNNISYNDKNYSAGRWKSDEHQRFVDAIIRYGNNWRQVQRCVGTRSSTQTRSHAQKFFEKLKRSKIFKTEKYDFSKNSLKILHDIMKSLPDKEYNQALKALHSLSYERNTNSENDKNIIQNNNDDINYINYNNNNNNCFENNENNLENNNYDGNNNMNNNICNEENIKLIKLFNQGCCFLECNNNNNKNSNNEDYMFCINSNNSNGIINNNNSNNNNLLINDFLKYDYKSYGRKESDMFSQRKKSLSEMNLNIKDSKEQNNNNVDDFNIDYNLCNNYFFNLNDQQDNNNKYNINTTKIIDFNINDDKIGYKQQYNNMDYTFIPQTSRKMSLEEKAMN